MRCLDRKTDTLWNYSEFYSSSIGGSFTDDQSQLMRTIVCAYVTNRMIRVIVVSQAMSHSREPNWLDDSEAQDSADGTLHGAIPEVLLADAALDAIRSHVPVLQQKSISQLRHKHVNLHQRMYKVLLLLHGVHAS